MRHILTLSLLLLFTLVGCQRPPMVLPTIFENGRIDPLADVPEDQQTATRTLFFATDRQHDPQAHADDWNQYTRHRSNGLDLGTIDVSFGDDTTWPEMRNAMHARGDGELLSPEIHGLNRIGTFDRRGASPDAAAPFIEALNAELDRSAQKEITIYIHGFKTNFENAILDASEYELYTGGLGPFIVYTWPSYNSLFEYSYDRDSARFTSAHARRFVAFLAEQINNGNLHAQRINFFTHSSGAEVLGSVLRELAMLSHEMNAEQRQNHWHIGSILMVAPDISTDVARERLLREDVAGMFDQIVVYLSRHDSALRWAQHVLYGAARLGTICEEDLTEEDHYWLRRSPNVALIDIDSYHYRGIVNHSHHRWSPAVGSDMILALRTDLTPTQRGLTRGENQTIWSFREDYVPFVNDAALQAYGVNRPADTPQSETE